LIDRTVLEKPMPQTEAASAAIYYHPEAYTTGGPKLMGRQAAGESFLRGYLRHSRAKEIWTQVQHSDHARHLARTARACGRNEPVRMVDKRNLAPLTQVGVVYHPGPVIGEHAWQRAAYGHGRWSLCGITHTTSSARAMDAIAELVIAPLQSWDAMICTSTAVKNNVERLLHAQISYLEARLGASRAVLPQLPVIPLGIHSRDFVFTEARRADARSAIGADGGTLVVLFMGRLSFHAKAHPLAMYQALETAVRATGRPVVLVECGWHANDFIANAYREAARQACPHVRVVLLDGRKAEDRQTAWAGADLFCSLSDNIQETFGITPVEAMAAGLPVVVADWDGYKDTVRDGVDGFRIPTLMPGAGMGADLALRHALELDTYDLYCGHACSLVAVDVDETAKAFVKLFESAERRRAMGAAGRLRAQKDYDWAAIIARYEAFWAELNHQRVTESKSFQQVPHPWPARMDPFDAFGAYPTRTLAPETILALVDTDAALATQRLTTWARLAMVNFARQVMPSESELQAVLAAAADGPRSAAELVDALPAARRPLVLRALVWLVKLGVLRIAG
jgi:glycosyltransferase involved in cell wall biosynthesis